MDERARELSGPGATWVAVVARTLLVTFAITAVAFDYGLAFGLLPRLEPAYRHYLGAPCHRATELAFSLPFRWSIVLFSLIGVLTIVLFWKLFDSRWGTVLVSLLVLILACTYGAFMLLAVMLPMVTMTSSGGPGG